MKRKQFKVWLLLLAVGAIFAACEGPAGTDGLNGNNGADGSDGVDGASGNATCMACHSTETKSNNEAQFAMSGHNEGNTVKYASYGPGCSGCHSHQGFVQFANTGSIGDITNPTAWECGTCHGLHETMEAKDYALRLSNPVVSKANGSHTLDLGGSSNLCVNCHQARKAPPVLEDGETDFVIPGHFGPHYGVQGNVVYGVGLAEIVGSVSYPEAGKAKHLNQASCTGCHMSEFSDENDQGGHSFIPSQNACNTCHETTDTGFEHNGARADFENKFAELTSELDRLGVITYDPVEEVYNFVEGPAFSIIEGQAGFNWKGLYQDHSHGAHNPVYVNAILMNSIEALKAIPTP